MTATRQDSGILVSPEDLKKLERYFEARGTLPPPNLSTERTTWDPRSAMAEEVVETLEGHQVGDNQVEPTQIMVLSCGHWDFLNAQEIRETSGLPRLAPCHRDQLDARVVAVCEI